jgi:hypothetical protein
MCYAIIEVKYAAAGEQDQLLKVLDEEACAIKISHLQSLETVAQFTLFHPAKTYLKKTVWEESE